MSALYPIDPTTRAQRPAYVWFSRNSRENRDASIAAGHIVEIHQDIAHINPPGSRDVVERDVVGWLSNLEFQVRDMQIPPDLADYYKRAYQKWCEGQEIPPEGTPIRGWHLLTSTDQERVISANILTVEDLAEIGHAQMQWIGMGAPAMVTKAKEWLAVSKSIGAATLQIEALQLANQDLTREVKALKAQIQNSPMLPPRRRKQRSDKGRPRHAEHTAADHSGGDAQDGR